MTLKKLVGYYTKFKNPPDREFGDCYTLRAEILVHLLKKIQKKLGVKK